jgi:hypothetical protein
MSDLGKGRPTVNVTLRPIILAVVLLEQGDAVVDDDGGNTP